LDVSVALAGGRFNYVFNGIGVNPLLRALGADVQNNFQIFTPKVAMNLLWENWRISANYMLLRVDSTFGLTPFGFEFPRIPFDSRTGGIGVEIDWKTLDSAWAPHRGHHLNVGVGSFSPAFGGTSSISDMGGTLCSKFLCLIEW
tara:strand:+ start:4680 stop:5111 length:432 start_codon:yes stop_codon:yes gene_type:complete